MSILMPVLSAMLSIFDREREDRHGPRLRTRWSAGSVKLGYRMWRCKVALDEYFSRPADDRLWLEPIYAHLTRPLTSLQHPGLD